MALENDLELLREKLFRIEKVLQWAAFTAVTEEELNDGFRAAWPDVFNQLSEARGELLELRDLLEAGRGLTQTQKTIVKDLGAVRDDGHPARCQAHGVGSGSSVPCSPSCRFSSDGINSFIGSLTRALPGLELVKEYEEHVELTIEHQSDTPPRVPISIVRE